MERYIAAIVIELERALDAARRYEDLRYQRHERHAPSDIPRQIFAEFYARQLNGAARAPARHGALRPGFNL
jgi:hypothetical protein